jgi:hypothetical protein
MPSSTGEPFIYSLGVEDERSMNPQEDLLGLYGLEYIV